MCGPHNTEKLFDVSKRGQLSFNDGITSRVWVDIMNKKEANNYSGTMGFYCNHCSVLLRMFICLRI